MLAVREENFRVVVTMTGCTFTGHIYNVVAKCEQRDVSGSGERTIAESY